jgi:plastocyanin
MKTSKFTLKSSIYFSIAFIFLLSFCSNKKVAPKTYTVEIVQMKFQPAVLNVHKGDTVIFVNKDIVDHDATEVNKAWNSPPLATGDSWKWVAEKSSDYYCSIHLVMKGQIIVD